LNNRYTALQRKQILHIYKTDDQMYIYERDAESKRIELYSIKDNRSNKAITLEPENTLFDARNILLRYNISRIVIARDNKALGIVREKDISRILYTEPQHRQFKEIRLDEVMNKNLITVKGEKDLKSCAKLMLEHKISSIPVLDEDGLLTGIATKSDLVDSYAVHYGHRKLVEDVVEKYMTKKVIDSDS